MNVLQRILVLAENAQDDLERLDPNTGCYKTVVVQEEIRQRIEKNTKKIIKLVREAKPTTPAKQLADAHRPEPGMDCQEHVQEESFDRWYAEEVLRGNNRRTSEAMLRQGYVEFCVENGLTRKDEILFFSLLTDRGHKMEYENGILYRRGLHIRRWNCNPSPET